MFHVCPSKRNYFHSNDVGVICFRKFLTNLINFFVNYVITCVIAHDGDMQLFYYFTEEYNKIYASAKERNHRAAIFHSNVKR